MCSINDDEFVLKFEQLSLEPIHFNHEGHIRLAYLYLDCYDFNTATNKVCNGIKHYAESLGASDKFNLTLTNAIVIIMSRRMEQQNNSSWQQFIANNPDIAADIKGVLSQYFSAKLLFSNNAKVALLEPDVQQW